MYRLLELAKYNAEFAFAESVLLTVDEAGLLKLCNFREMKIADFHRGNYHFE
jgi:hypothetical protein